MKCVSGFLKPLLVIMAAVTLCLGADRGRAGVDQVSLAEAEESPSAEISWPALRATWKDCETCDVGVGEDCGTSVLAPDSRVVAGPAVKDVVTCLKESFISCRQTYGSVVRIVGLKQLGRAFFQVVKGTDQPCDMMVAFEAMGSSEYKAATEFQMRCKKFDAMDVGEPNVVDIVEPSYEDCQPDRL